MNQALISSDFGVTRPSSLNKSVVIVIVIVVVVVVVIVVVVIVVVIVIRETMLFPRLYFSQLDQFYPNYH